MKCTNCGNKIGPDDEFCEKCGMRVEPDIVYEENDVREDTDDDVSGSDTQDVTDGKPPRKLSKWTTAGIVAAVGISGAFITAVLANNIGNFFASPDEGSVVAQEETTTQPSTTAAPASEPADDKPESAVYSEPPIKRDSYNNGSGYDREDSSYSSEPSYDDKKEPSYSYDENDSSYSYGDQSSSNDDFYNNGWSNDNTESSSSYDDSDESPYYYRYGEDEGTSSGTDTGRDHGDDTGQDQDSYDENSYNDNSYSEDIRRYLEDAGDQIIEYGEQIDSSINDTINGYRDRLNDLRNETGW